MKQADYIRLTAQIAVLKEIAVDYSGKGTWESNPWVFVYDFELVK